VRTQVDERLREEASRFSFRFACEDCLHRAGEGRACTLEYPPAPRRDDLGGPELELCKSFEIG
jgi:hypothetical protein